MLYCTFIYRTHLPFSDLCFSPAFVLQLSFQYYVYYNYALNTFLSSRCSSSASLPFNLPLCFPAISPPLTLALVQFYRFLLHCSKNGHSRGTQKGGNSNRRDEELTESNEGKRFAATATKQGTTIQGVCVCVVCLWLLLVPRSDTKKGVICSGSSARVIRKHDTKPNKLVLSTSCLIV